MMDANWLILGAAILEGGLPSELMDCPGRAARDGSIGSVPVLALSAQR